MIHSTKGIVLHSFKYGESGMIARILTPSAGLLSFLVHGVRKARSKNKAHLLQPLTLLDMVVYIKPGDQLQNIREIQCSTPFATIHTDIRKTTMALFLAEVLLNTCKHQQIQEEAYHYIENSILLLDREDTRMADFHLIFLLHLTQYLGFFPARNYSATHCYFNLQEGSYQQTFHGDAESLEKNESHIFFALSDAQNYAHDPIPMPREKRLHLLYKIIDYYRYHLDGFKEVKSLKVLEAVFH